MLVTHTPPGQQERCCGAGLVVEGSYLRVLHMRNRLRGGLAGNADVRVSVHHALSHHFSWLLLQHAAESQIKY